MYPIIGLTSQYNDLISREKIEINNSYIKAISNSGGIPVIIPIVENENDAIKYIELIDGLIITGGVDINPSMYGQNPLKYTQSFCNIRDELEMKLLKVAIKKFIPVLGICRGHQLINIVMGGTLFQDIPSQVFDSHGHYSKETMKEGYHKVNLEKNGYLNTVFKKDVIVVNSLHHQSIDKLGINLKIAARSTDGIIEAIESDDGKKIFGVQFHPEDLAESNEKYLEIFKFFIKNL